MGNYEYDSKVNRDLARTAMNIYTKSHGIKSLNESTQNINEEVLRENINSLILNYVSDVIILAEQELGREMTDVEINEASIELLNRINSISDEEKTAFVTELAEAAGPSMTGTQSAPADGVGTAPSGAEAKPGVGMRPTAGSDTGGYDIAPGEEGFAQQFSSISDYLTNGFPLFGAAGLTYILSEFGSDDAGSGGGVAPAAAAGLRRRR
jgi:hypothetical protein